jgi:hypothetical protein
VKSGGIGGKGIVTSGRLLSGGFQCCKVNETVQEAFETVSEDCQVSSSAIMFSITQRVFRLSKSLLRQFKLLSKLPKVPQQSKTIFKAFQLHQKFRGSF